MSNNISVIDSCDELLRELQLVRDKMSNLGREKDYKVQKISKKYESEIEDYMRQEDAILLQISVAQEYAKRMSGDTRIDLSKTSSTRKRKA